MIIYIIIDAYKDSFKLNTKSDMRFCRNGVNIAYYGWFSILSQDMVESLFTFSIV